MAWYDEAVEVNSSSPQQDLELFATVTQKIRDIIQQITQVKLKAPDRWKETILELQLQGSLHFLTLKKLNRIAQIRCKNVKDDTLESKQKLDGNNLMLQNLQYEISHLDREVNNCLQFKSKHEDIDLVPVAEFYAEAPKEISKEEETVMNEHLQTLARLDWELENRKRLAEELKHTYEVKESACAGIKKRRQDLNSLRPSLDSLLKSTLGLQEALGNQVTAAKALQDNACLLPRPLYVLFIQARAYSEACNSALEVLIGGDTATAEKVAAFEQKTLVIATDTYTNSYPDDSDSDNEDKDEQEERGRRKSTSKAQSAEDVHLSDSFNDLSKHPLYVCLKLFLGSDRSDGSHLQLKFHYYKGLEIVTVIPSLEMHEDTQSFGSYNVLCAESLLNNLQEAEQGDVVMDNAATQLHKASSLQENEFAYLWAQKLAGLEVLSSGDTNDMQTSYANMQRVVKLIRRRLNSRVSLGDQLTKFSSNQVTCDSLVTKTSAASIHFRLTAWRPIDFKTYSSLEYTSGARELGLSSAEDYLYVASAQRGASANIEVAVAISARYPDKWPLFCIHFCWRGNRTAENDLNIREIEVDVNCRVPEDVTNMSRKLRNQILSAQMYRLMSLLDVYVETDCTKEGNDLPAEFATNKLCPRLVKGLARLKPFKYDARHEFQSY